MASLTLYSGSLDSAPYVLPCFDLDFMAAFNNRSHNHWDFFIGRHVWSLAEPWIGFGVAFDASFTVDGVRYDLLEGLSGAFPFPNPQWRYNANTKVDLDPAFYDTFTVAADTAQPDDWENNYLSYFYFSHASGDTNEYLYAAKNQTWENFRSSVVSNSGGRGLMHRTKSPSARLFISHGGLHDFTFGVRTTVQRSVTGTGSTNYIVSGMSGAASLPNANVGSTSANPFAYTDLTTGTQLYNAYSVVRSSGGTTNQGSKRVQTYPVAFTVPKGTVFPRGTSSAYPAITFGEDTQMLGIMCVSFSAYGTPDKISLQVMSKNMWAAKSATSGAGAGSDTVPTGGKGKQTSSKYNPSEKTITKNTAGGLLSDPTASAGFVIYKFTPDQFTDFLNKVYTETALPSIGNTLAGIGAESNNIGQILSNIATGRGWSNTENIVFVKTSPVNFPSVGRQLAKLSIGVLGIVPSEAVQVVTQYIVSGSHDFLFPNPAQWFTDVEPYASNQIYFPLAGSVALPPSIINGASGKINYAYNLLNNSCGYSLFIGKEGGYQYLAKNGECAKSADCVIPGRDISGTVGAVGALAATGIATLATGGTTAPALLTSALGAATEAVHEANDLSITNMPPASSGSPYDDTVYGGLRDIVLYRAKAERFTSGESDVNNPLRSQVIGTASGFYVSALDDIKDGSYVSCHEVMLSESAGMTKAEADKIRAFLSEGVYI